MHNRFAECTRLRSHRFGGVASQRESNTFRAFGIDSKLASDSAERLVARRRSHAKVATVMSGAPVTAIRHRLIALLGGMGMLCSVSGVLPSLITLAGQLDDDHHVAVSASVEKLQIRFHHAHDTAPRTDASARLVFDEHRLDSPADHIIEFVAAGDSLAALPSLAALDHGLHAIGVVESSELLVPIARPCLAGRYARPPPSAATWSRCLRSVVLLV